MKYMLPTYHPHVIPDQHTQCGVLPRALGVGSTCPHVFGRRHAILMLGHCAL